MKKYYKFFILLLVISFVVPQITFASWWNPFSWGIWNNIFHKTDTKTQVLENRVKELENKLNDKSVPTSDTTKTDKTKEGATTDSTQQPSQQPAKQSEQKSAQPIQQPAQQPDNKTTGYKKTLTDRAIAIYSNAKARIGYSEGIVETLENRINALSAQIVKNQSTINAVSTPALKLAMSDLNEYYNNDISYCQIIKRSVSNNDGFNSLAKDSISDANEIYSLNVISDAKYTELDNKLKELEYYLPKFITLQDNSVSDLTSFINKQKGVYDDYFIEFDKLLAYLKGLSSGTSSNNYNQVSHAPSLPLYIPPVKSTTCYFRWYGTSGSMECY